MGRKSVRLYAGKQVGKWTLVENMGSVHKEGTRGPQYYWKCRCACGQESLVGARHLRQGETLGCRQCWARRHTLLYPGFRVGKLVVVSRTDEVRNTQWMWACLCDCGRTKVVRAGDLLRKDGNAVRSCGCARDGNRTHGQAGNYFTGRRQSRDYGRFKALKSLHRDQFCPEWAALHGFQVFHAEMGSKPAGHWLRRKDVEKPWSRENCWWAPKPALLKSITDELVSTLSPTSGPESGRAETGCA